MADGQNNFPFVSLFIAITTLVTSLTIGVIINGSIFGTVKIIALARWGGITFADVRNFELWRLATAQLVHVKQMHMVYNVLCLGALGALVEKRLGGLSVFAVWLIAGGIATLIGAVFAKAPYNVGAGASQACLALAGCAIALFFAGFFKRRTAILIFVLTILPPFMLDFIFAGYPKIGHVLGLSLGALFGMMFIGLRRQGT